MKISTKLLVVAVILLTVAGYLAYTKFSTYSPKITNTAEIIEARGGYVLPLPPKTVVLSTTDSSNNRTDNLESELTSREVQNFYKSLLLANNWEAKNEDTQDGFELAEFSNREGVIKITTSTNNTNKTIVVVQSSFVPTK